MKESPAANANEPANLERIVSAAESVGARDVFVFRRVSCDRYVHVGGVGRGEGWAGNLELREGEEPLAEKAAAEGAPVRLTAAESTRVVGPYYARSAALVPVSHDVIVLFGRADAELADRSDAELVSAAEAAAEAIELVSPAKRLADELEVLHAVETLTKTEARRVPEVMQHIAESAASSLSCELAVLSLHDRAEVAVAGRDSPVDADADEIAAAMREVSERETAPAICVHDTTSDPLPAPFTRAAGIRPHYLLSIGKPSMRLLLLMHTDACPRGFTMLCRQLGLRLAESAEGLLRGAVIRELEEQHAVALAKANERLVEVNRMKDDFVAFIVHELARRSRRSGATSTCSSTARSASSGPTSWRPSASSTATRTVCCAWSTTSCSSPGRKPADSTSS